MQKCLGIYIEDNLIKYAKVSKEKDDVKVETFGVRFFQNLGDELKKLVEETYSFGTPISINLANEKYLYFDIFALLNKKDIETTVKTEFESFCEEKNYNSNAFEVRHTLMPNLDDKEKIRSLNVYVNKIEINRQIEEFTKYKLSKVMPMPIAIANIARLNKRENEIIVNMEETTSVTTVYDGQIYKIDTIEVGSKEVLTNINKLENSYAKAYEICKNTTIYTAESEELSEEQPYLQYIMPTIYKITEQLQTIVRSDTKRIQTIYLTGTLSAINNIDLYFQEFFPDIECKILKPRIVDETITKINIKDYVEVNSAIALATIGLGEGLQEMNFKRTSTGDKLAEILKVDKIGGKKEGKASNKKANLKFDFNTALSPVDVWLLRGIFGVIFVFLVFVIFSKLLSNQMLEKEEEIKDLISTEKSEIEKVNSNSSILDGKTQKYNTLIADLKRISEKISDAAARRNSIPNLLNQIMANIPNRVQLTSIENTTDRTIAINAQSFDYEQLGMFIASIKTKKILKNTVSSSTSKASGIITITVEGELP